MVIYVDVLFVVNFFITYLLLLLTKLISKKNAKVFRLASGAFVGGAYSLVIFAQDLHFLLTAAGKVLASAVIVFIAFGFKRLTEFLKCLGVFYLANMVLLGAVLGVWLIFRPDGIVINNDTVYFDIPAPTLLVCALFAYLISLAAVKIYNRTLGSRDIYSLTVFKNGIEKRMYAFADSGNKLREPFSDYPVIVVDKGKLTFETERIIPFSTVGGEGTLRAFRPDKVIISSGKKSVETDKVYIAVSDVDSKDFSAIINPEIINI